MKKRIIKILTLFIILLTINSLNAVVINTVDSFYEDKWIPNVYIMKTEGSNWNSYSYEQVKFIRKRSTGEHVYCVEPFVKLQSGVNYQGYGYSTDISNVMPNMTTEKWNRIVLLTQYGYGYKDANYDHTDPRYYGITQYLVWKAVHPGILIQFCDSIADCKANRPNDSRWNNEINEIEALIANHNVVPSFSIEQNLIIGRTYTYTDNRGVLGSYEVTDASGCEVWKNGNTINIKPTIVGNISFNLRKGDPNANSTLYVKEGAQNVMTKGTLAVNQSYSTTSVGGKIKIKKSDASKGYVAQGNASLVDATFLIRNSSGAEVARITTNENGECETDWLDLGNYTIEEIVPPRGYKKNNQIYTCNITAQNIDPSNPVFVIEVKDEIKRGRVEVTKYDNNMDNSVKGVAAGAELRLILTDDNGTPKINSDGTYVYSILAKLDQYGNANFIDEQNAKIYGKDYTIPYGTYIIKEEKGADATEGYYLYFIDNNPFKVANDANEDYTRVYRIYHDMPIPVRLTIIKKDVLTNQIIKIEGSVFKIWDVDRNIWVTRDNVDEFVSNSEGMVTLPYLISAGRYKLYESSTPKGYIIPNEYKIPSRGDMSESDYYNLLDNNGKDLNISDKELNLTIEQKQLGYNQGLEYPYQTDISNKPMIAEINIQKYGLMITGEIKENRDIEGETYEIHKPQYEQRGLEGVEYTVYAKEEIRSIDGNNVYYAKGQEVAKILTDVNGVGKNDKEIYLGKVTNSSNYESLRNKAYGGVFEIRETKTPYGYQVAQAEDIIITEDDLNGDISIAKRTYYNDKNHVYLSFKKRFKDSNYITGKEKVKKAAFAIYTNQDIMSYDGKKVIDSGSIVDIVEYDSDSSEEILKSDVDLPEGTYNYQEIYVSDSYIIDNNTYEVTLNYDENDPEKVVESEEIVNIEDYVSSLIIAKFSNTYFAKREDIGYIGELEINEKFVEEVENILDNFKNRPIGELKKEFEDNTALAKTMFLKDAKYQIFMDKEATTPLKYKNGDEEIDVVFDTNLGYGVVENIPLGTYYLKEIEAPVGSMKSESVVEINIKDEESRSNIYRLVRDDSKGVYITKTDAFTSELVPNCTFSITDEAGNELVRNTTDERGLSFIPVDIFEKGKTYYYEELYAPDTLYELNDEKISFVADYSYDEEGNLIWNKKEDLDISNYRKYKKLRVLKLDSKTSKPLKGCIFTIVMIDENGEEVKRPDGSTVYLVQNAVTDENGEFIIEKAYYGKYKFIEVQAPEGYELNEKDMEGYVFEINDTSKDQIDFIITNTGDIAVYTFTAIAIFSILGIYIVIKRKKNK